MSSATMSVSPPIEELWREFGFAPNDAQRAAILHTDSPLYLPAGPGSGKTRVLLWRTLNLLVYHDVAPREIFLATFTEKAALQLQEGLRTLISVVTNITDKNYDLGEMYVGTIHSLCQRLIGDRSRRLDRQRVRPPHLLDALGQYFHLADHSMWTALCTGVHMEPEGVTQRLNEMWGIRSESRHHAVQNFIAFCNRLAEESIAPEEAAETLRVKPEVEAFYQAQHVDIDTVGFLLEMARCYHAMLEEQRLTTFSLLQQRAFDATDSLTPGTFRYIIIDEYQDTNPIQERIFFKLAETHGNLCVVGDDDQALYRFRGSTVENFVEFPARCLAELGREATVIPLVTNYRSRQRIVNFYGDFIDQCNWLREDGAGHYRVVSKRIVPYRLENGPAVVKTAPSVPLNTCAEIADFVTSLLAQGVVSDPNQIAFLFPGLQFQGRITDAVARMRDALEDRGLRVYAPRAGRFLDTPEARDVFGVFTTIFGVPAADPEYLRGTFGNYQAWLAETQTVGRALAQADPALDQWVKLRRGEIDTALADLARLRATVGRMGWDAEMPYQIRAMKAALINVPGLSERARRSLNSAYFENMARQREMEGKPYTLRYVMARVTALDWSILDLFYQMCGFEHFRAMFVLAEEGRDEGPICNLGLITQYLNRFIDTYITIPTAANFEDGRFSARFFGSFVYALYRLGESEYEDEDDPFPRGRIPFITVHQSKGLEFPVVIVANPRKDIREPSQIEVMVRPLLKRNTGEPLVRMSEFDVMRMFYVAFSRAENLLVFGNIHGQGQRINPPIRNLLENGVPLIDDVDLAEVPRSTENRERIGRPYSYTGDYLAYLRCPRQYMVFRKYGLVPARSQTMFFGSLIHRTLEDLHNHLITQRGGGT